MGVTLLHFRELEVWRMTPYKLLELFYWHRVYNPDKFERPKPKDMDDIDYAMGGML